ncbi:MAG TPA: DUF2141 domain-containing protein [Terracidiphilus sp.]|jgi:uncharacterized protein (DUF2141 family)|nr:DUF2141 domain-containing protein [Terracidiphilus sp.]
MMTCVRALLLLLLASGFPVSANLRAEEPGGCALRVHVEGLRNSAGVVGVLLFRSADGWPENVTKAVRHEAAPVAAGQHGTTVAMSGLDAGDYGVVVLHDENKNMKLDRNFFGIPKEGFGFANNPHVGLGAPAFRDAVLHVGCPVTQTTIRIVYK